ncbi:MAG: DUF4097 domain-containing protein [Clostridia bacterium]|nr:DUF4097 domain-containing protein [Clostridia bacterium]
MKLRKRILFLMLVAILVIALSVILSACGKIFAYECVYENSELYTIADHGEVEMTAMCDLDIKWFIGSITVQKSDEVSAVTFYEENTGDMKADANETMHYYFDGKKLHIRYGKSGRLTFRPGGIVKNLYVCVPSTLTLQNVEIETTRTDEATVTGITADEVSIAGDGRMHVECTAREVGIEDSGKLYVNCPDSDVSIKNVYGSVNGECTAKNVVVLANDVVNLNCTAKSVVIKSYYHTYCDVNLDCTADEIDIKTGSGDVTLTCDALPKNLNIETESGVVQMYLTNERAFSVVYNTQRGEFEYEFDGLCRGDDMNAYNYLGGVQPNDEYYYVVNTQSGNLKVERMVEEK